MTLGVTEDSNYTNIANAIRSVSASGTSQTMTPAEMASAIQALKATWGHIDGTLSDQTDLKTILDSMINDTAGEGNTDTAWSADRSSKEIKTFDRLHSFEKKTFDYGYDLSYNVDPNPSGSYSTKIGVVRNGIYVVINGNNNSGYAIGVKLSGEVKRSVNIDSFTPGIKFEDGKRYRAIVQKVSGSNIYNGNEELLSTRIYKAGTTTEIGIKIYDYENNRFITEFVADSSEYNVVFYVPNGRNVTNYACFVYIEEVQPESEINLKAGEDYAIKESVTITELGNAYISENGTATSSSYYKLYAAQVSPDNIYQVRSYFIPNNNRRCQWAIVNQQINANNYLTYTAENVLKRSIPQGVMQGEGGYRTSDYFYAPTGSITLLISSGIGTGLATADKIIYISNTESYNIKKSQPIAKIGYNNISWVHDNENCDLLITGPITLYLNNTAYNLTAEELYSLANASSIVTLRSDNTIRSSDFALVFDIQDKTFKFLAFSNSQTSSGRYVLLFGHYYSSTDAVGLLVDYCLEKRVYNLELYSDIKKSQPIAKIGYNNISWVHANANCDLLITGQITLYLNNTTYILTAEELYSLADASSIVTLRSDNTIRSYDFALVFDIQDKTFKFLAFSNSQTSSGRYVLLFGHYYSSTDAVGLLVDYCLEKRVYNLESVTETTGIADYFVTEAQTTVSSLYNVADEPCYTICFVTDSHHNNSKGDTQDIWSDTIKNLTYINHLYPFDAIIHGGDLITGGVAKTTAQRLISEMRQGMIAANHNTYILTGNHDDNSYPTYDVNYYLDESARYAIIHKNTAAKAYNYGYESFYYDIDTLGIRVICLCCLCGIGSESSSNVWGYTDDLLSWFQNEALSTNNQVVIFSHMAFTNTYMVGAPNPKNGTNMQNAVNSFIQNGGTIIGLIFGHVHYDILGKPTGSNFYQMGTSCSWCKENSKTPPSGGSVPSREAGTVTADCWDCIVIKPLSRKVHAIRFGAGSDREYTY